MLFLKVKIYYKSAKNVLDFIPASRNFRYTVKNVSSANFKNQISGIFLRNFLKMVVNGQKIRKVFKFWGFGPILTFQGFIINISLTMSVWLSRKMLDRKCKNVIPYILLRYLNVLEAKRGKIESFQKYFVLFALHFWSKTPKLTHFSKYATFF